MLIARWWLGRTLRGQFWFQTASLWIILCAAFVLLGRDRGNLLAGVVSLLFLCALALLCARRLHDLGRSAWWLLAALLPVAGAVWLLWQLGFKRGQSHTNRWGDRPGRY